MNMDKQELIRHAQTALGEVAVLSRKLRSLSNAGPLLITNTADKTRRAIEKLLREVEELHL